MTPTLKRFTVAFLVILAFTLLFARLERGALHFDEAIYAQVSKEMVERNE
jgi:4-amino-4-deoxy-L-arabinose transferase-like glycosyltransferase